jgi:hypothetical protein
LTMHDWYKQCRQPTRCNSNGLLIIPISSTCFGRWYRPSTVAIDCVYSLWFNAPTLLPTGSLEAEELRFQATGRHHRSVRYTTSCKQSSAPVDGRYHRPKHVELIGIINKPLLLHPFDCLYYLYQWCTIKQISNLWQTFERYPSGYN